MQETAASAPDGFKGPAEETYEEIGATLLTAAAAAVVTNSYDGGVPQGDVAYLEIDTAEQHGRTGLLSSSEPAAEC